MVDASQAYSGASGVWWWVFIFAIVILVINYHLVKM